MKNNQIILASRPQGRVEDSNFRLVESDLPAIHDGQVLTAVRWLSLDPYMRGRMDDRKSYAAPQALGAVMVGGTVEEVLESRNPLFRAGDVVVGMSGWQQFAISDGTGLRKVDARVPISLYLGCVGMPGVTAWYGLNEIGRPRPGETVVVSAAAGAVGSVVGQLAKLEGCRAVGIAGGKEKCEHVVRDLGFDVCVDYKSESFREEYKRATAQGIDVVFENVGGKVLDAALARMNAFGRIAVCGLIAGYNGEDIAIANVRSILTNRLLVQGFIVSEHMDLWPKALAELASHVVAGKIKYRETVAVGLENAPRAFMGLLRGENLGKQLVKVS